MWRIATFDVSSAFFQGDSLQREVYVKDPEGPGFWVLNAALYMLREGARNWYDRFHRHCISLGFTTAPGDPAAYSYDKRWDSGRTGHSCRWCHYQWKWQVFHHSSCPVTRSVLYLLELEESSFKFLGMHIKQTNDFSVHIKQDTKSIKNLPPGWRFFKGGRETRNLEISGRSTAVPWPYQARFDIPDLWLG